MIKYGLLVNENNGNIGDDIQAYAEAQFLPRVDVIVDRENLDIFKYGNGKDPVALIMGAWFMWHKYNWPPSRQIVPLVLGYHHFERNRNVYKALKYALPIFTENYEGIGGQWFKDHGRVGCRDLYTCRVLDEAGIPNYFSGCVTLTLPKQKTTKDKGKYIVLVDITPEAEKKIRKMVKGKYEVRKISHFTENINGATWEERVKRVEELLTQYQNAAYVVTMRLHVALPCLAMETPVLVIEPPMMNDPNRFEPYKDWLHYVTTAEFLDKGCKDFDFINGTPNKKDYLEYRESLTKTMKEFVDYCEKNKNKPLSFFDKISYSDEELAKWRIDFMRTSLKKAHVESKKMLIKFQTLDEIPLKDVIWGRFRRKHIIGYNKMVLLKKIKHKIFKKKKK